MKVFFDPRQNVEYNPSFSPSAGKPAKVIASWEQKFPIEICAVEPCTREDLYLAHDKNYIDGVLDCKINNGFENKLPTIAESLLWTNGSFVTAAKYAVQHKENVVSPTSGFHHAEWNRGMGYCTFNGLMVAAITLKELGWASRIAIIDIDMHYGNGTDDIIERLGIDYVSHYSWGNFPFVGDDFTVRLKEILEEKVVGCDVIFYQAGADPHVNDPYGGFLTTEQLRLRDEVMFKVARDAKIPVVWNLAGGYQVDISKVLEIHDNTMKVCLEVYKE
jgi:acetoin utilization deacetylase AcuC-like enzyme